MPLLDKPNPVRHQDCYLICYLEKNIPLEFALKGLNISAQGNALGNTNHPKILLKALKGRNKMA